MANRHKVQAKASGGPVAKKCGGSLGMDGGGTAPKKARGGSVGSGSDKSPFSSAGGGRASKNPFSSAHRG